MSKNISLAEGDPTLLPKPAAGIITKGLSLSFKVVILSYNHPQLTAKTVSSVLGQIPASQILLVHNGGLKSHQESLQEKFPQIEHLHLAENRGFSGGANAGLKKAFAEQNWALFLTNDCELKTWELPPEPAMVAPLIWNKRNQIDSLGGYLNLAKAHLRHCKSKEEAFNYVPGTAFWMHQEIFKALEGFDEGLGTYWEDVDFSLRARKQNLLLQTSEKTQVIHAIGKTCHKDSHYTTYLFQRNRKRVCLKHVEPQVVARLQVYLSLGKDWCQLAWRQFKNKDWARMKLLAKASRDSRN